MSTSTNLVTIDTGSDKTLSPWYTPGCEYTPQDHSILPWGIASTQSFNPSDSDLFVSDKQRIFFTHTIFVQIASIDSEKLYFNILFHQIFHRNSGLYFKFSIPINVKSARDFDQIITSVFLNNIPLLLPLRSIVMEYYAPHQELCKIAIRKVLKDSLDKSLVKDTLIHGTGFRFRYNKTPIMFSDPSSIGITILHDLLLGGHDNEYNDHLTKQIGFLQSEKESLFDFLFSQNNAIQSPILQRADEPLARPVYTLRDGNVEALHVYS